MWFLLHPMIAGINTIITKLISTAVWHNMGQFSTSILQCKHRLLYAGLVAVLTSKLGHYKVMWEAHIFRCLNIRSPFQPTQVISILFRPEALKKERKGATQKFSTSQFSKTQNIVRDLGSWWQKCGLWPFGLWQSCRWVTSCF